MIFLKDFTRIRHVFGPLFLFLFLFLAHNALGASTIAGTIYDKQRNPLPDIEVELLDDLYRVRPGGRTRTDGAGKYQFDGLVNGRYTVRVFAFRYDLEDQEIPVEIATQGANAAGSAYILQDFYLLPKRGGLRDTELTSGFQQDVPKEAKTAYEKAVEGFTKKRDEEAFTNLKKAIELYPTYYTALQRFGMELYTRKQYLEAAQVFMEAIKVNEKSATSFYYLGAALSNLGKDYQKAAMNALNKAYALAPASPQVLFMMGKLERGAGKFAEAEAHLLAAKKQSKSPVPDIHKELAQLYANDLKKFKEAADELELYMKAAKLDGDEGKKTKKTIADLREKAKTEAVK
jgi:hypothetical protein